MSGRARYLLVCLCLWAALGSARAQEASLPGATAPGAALEEALLPLVGDVERGRLVFGPCRACHSVEPGAVPGAGPGLHRIFGRVAGKQEGFGGYSPGFREAAFVWTPRVMYAWLENPLAFFPDSTMMSAGVSDPRQRADLIAYLEWASAREP